MIKTRSIGWSTEFIDKGTRSKGKTRNTLKNKNIVSIAVISVLLIISISVWVIAGRSGISDTQDENSVNIIKSSDTGVPQVKVVEEEYPEYEAPDISF